MCAALLAAGSQTLTAPGPAAQGRVTLAAVGDVMLARSVARAMASHGPGYPFVHMREFTHGADILFGNLESPLTDRDFALSKRYLFGADPSGAAALADAGFGVLSVANNHALDCGPPGLADTLTALEAAHVGACGIAVGASRVSDPCVLQAGGLRVAFVAFSQWGPFSGAASGPAIAEATEASVRRSVGEARGRADVIVASFHWGIEYDPGPSTDQERLARAAAEAGADIVLGHHPHTLQGMAFMPSCLGRRRVLVAYSLGNFVFDQAGETPSRTVILRCVLDSRGVVGARVVPASIEACQPRTAKPAEAAAILARLRRLSRPLGADILPSGEVVGSECSVMAGQGAAGGIASARP